MSLAGISLGALLLALAISCFSETNIGILALVFAWIVGVYFGGMSPDQVLAGFPTTVPGVTVNRLCGSSVEAVIQGSRAIEAGDADVILAGGVESMSRAPFVVEKSA